MADERVGTAPLAGFDGLRFRHWRLEARADGVIVVAIDRAGQAVNALSQEMLVELDALLERLAIDPPRGVVFRSGKASGFVAGADVREFQEFDARGTVDELRAIAGGNDAHLTEVFLKLTGGSGLQEIDEVL